MACRNGRKNDWNMSMKTFIAAIALAMLAGQVQAQARTANCAPRAEISDRLAQKYRESQQMVGLTASGAMVEIFANTETGTWTAMITKPNGIACLVSSGSSFERIKQSRSEMGDKL